VAHFQMGPNPRQADCDLCRHAKGIGWPEVFCKKAHHVVIPREDGRECGGCELSPRKLVFLPLVMAWRAVTDLLD
jgi:hypothetical protein